MLTALFRREKLSDQNLSMACFRGCIIFFAHVLIFFALLQGAVPFPSSTCLYAPLFFRAFLSFAPFGLPGGFLPLFRCDTAGFLFFDPGGRPFAVRLITFIGRPRARFIGTALAASCDVDSFSAGARSFFSSFLSAFSSRLCSS